MIGYLIFNSQAFCIEKVNDMINKLITFEHFKSFQSENSTIIMFKNKYPNNHFFETKEHFIAATGTFIFEGEIGTNALRKISNYFLNDSDSYEALYSKFTGHYNLIYFDKIRKKNIILTDREGLQSGFTYDESGKRVYSSNLILLAALVEAEIDFESVRDFVHIGTTINGRTIFAGIRQMDSATMYEENDDGWATKRLWEIKVEELNYNYSDREIINELSNRLMAHLNFIGKLKESEVCTDLSGGTDSRTILSFLLKIKNKVDINVAGPADHEDVIIHKKIAELLKLHSLWYQDPIEDYNISHKRLLEAIEIADATRNPISLMPALPFFNQRGKKYSILLGGNGGPLFKDHYWLFEFNRINRRREPNWRRIANLSTIDYPWQDSIFKTGGKEGKRLAKLYESHSQRIQGTNNQKLDYVYFDLKMKAYHSPQFTTCNQFFNVYHPFCDGRLVELSMNIKPYIRKGANLQFAMIYNNSKKLAWILTNNGCPAVPSIGKFFYLKAYVLLRYARALWRKIGMYILRRNVVQSVYGMALIYEQLKTMGYIDNFLNLDSMKTASLYRVEELNRMINNPRKGSNLDYLLNILAVEMSIKQKENLEGKSYSIRDHGK